jgi:pimeloyl-ACP methyl ester carboxylesterase
MGLAPRHTGGDGQGPGVIRMARRDADTLMRLVAMLVGCIIAVPTAAAEAMLKQVGDAHIAVELLGHSGPTVVFESGLGEGIHGWAQVAPALAACARVVLYDRPGIGRSSPHTASSIVLAGVVADRLAELLRGIGAAPPYILVGHSLGGLYVQSFARRHPNDVAAVVLVDSASPFEPPGMFVSSVPYAPGSVAAAEEGGVAPSVAAMLAGPAFPPVPLFVLAATDHGDTAAREAAWREVQMRTAALSPKGRIEMVVGSGHFIQNDRPQAVIAAILRAARENGVDVSNCRIPSSER